MKKYLTTFQRYFLKNLLILLTLSKLNRIYHFLRLWFFDNLFFLRKNDNENKDDDDIRDNARNYINNAIKKYQEFEMKLCEEYKTNDNELLNLKKNNEKRICEKSILRWMRDFWN